MNEISAKNDVLKNGEVIFWSHTKSMLKVISGGLLFLLHMLACKEENVLFFLIFFFFSHKFTVTKLIRFTTTQHYCFPVTHDPTMSITSNCWHTTKSCKMYKSAARETLHSRVPRTL